MFPPEEFFLRRIQFVSECGGLVLFVRSSCRQRRLRWLLSELCCARASAVVKRGAFVNVTEFGVLHRDEFGVRG